jgi:peptide/nickel transport system ATP-binding protein
VVGESGCGKSTMARCIMRLLEPTAGRIVFDGSDISKISGKDLFAVRREMMMVFQDPYASLNPRKRVGSIVGEALEIHKMGTDAEIRRKVQDLLDVVGLNPEHYNRFPHEFSGGQRQRIGVARALAVRPKLIVCDEPVSALDVVRHISDRVAVMYLGKVVELGTGTQLYNRPLHPYSGALLSAVPIPNPNVARSRKPIVLEGDVPSPINPPSACRFHPRCPRFQAGTCDVEEPQLTEREAGHEAACHFPLETWPMADLRLEPGHVAAS